MTAPSAAARAAVLDSLRILAARGDLGADEAFVRAVSLRRELAPGHAAVCRKILARHTDRLPAVLMAVAAEDGADAPASEPPARRRGRPCIGADILSPAERTRRRRSGGDLVALEASIICG